MPRSRIYQGIYPWERVAVFKASLVEVYEIYAHTPVSIGLFNHDDVCEPVRVIYFPDETCL